MSLVTQITALAARVAAEFKTVRSEIGILETGTSFPTSPVVGQTFFATDVKVAYVYSGTDWLAMTPVGVTDGGDANLQPTYLTTDGGDA